MEQVTTLTEIEYQHTLCKDIVAHIHAAYEASTKLTELSGLNEKERDGVSQGLYLMRENIMLNLDMKEVQI